MGHFRFHRSIRLGRFFRLNLNKKSVSVTGGVQGAHHTWSSTGQQTSSVGLPGTGLSYRHTSRWRKATSSRGFMGVVLLVIIVSMIVGAYLVVGLLP